ncbi:MAG: ATP-binding protein [Bacillota bacterium]
MFSEIRRRLTLQYAAMMAFFLLTFVLVCFLGVTYLTTTELNQSLRLLAREEAEEQAAIYQHKGMLEGNSEQTKLPDEDFGGQLFYYVFDRQGTLMNSLEPGTAIRQAVLERIAERRLAEGKTDRYDFRLANGHHRTVIITARPILDGQKPIGFLYIGMDVSTQYRLLRNVFFILVGLVFVFLLLAGGAANFMAGRAIIPIKQSFQRQRDFVADASHELRTPLSVLLASVDAIKMDGENKISDFSRQVFADMKDEIQKMSKIVTDLLTLARADVGALCLMRENFDFRPEAERIIRSVQPLAAAKEISLELDSPESAPVYADRERLGQLLMILLDNAIKYTPAGGKAAVHIELSEYETGGDLIVKVEDTGIGIDVEYQNRIFERFYRADKVRSRAIGGNGLGLAIAQWIVKEHRGTIKVESQPEKGTTFTVVIPALQGE